MPFSGRLKLRGKSVLKGALLFSFCLVTQYALLTPAEAQKPGTCDRELRATHQVVLSTPFGSASGRLCLDDGDSFSLGPTFVRIRGLDAPEIGRNCVKKFDPLPPRCESSAGAVEALIQLSTLLEASATCVAEKKDQYNRWVADCTLPGSRNVANEMIGLGFACATKEGADFRTSELEARKLERGLWAQKWVGKRDGFPSSQCVVSNRSIKRHIQYQRNKSARRG